jgi:hypothetical protein
MNNQQKGELIDDIFCIRSFWGGHDKFLPKTGFMHEGAICLELLNQQPVEFPAAVIRKSITIWSRLMDHLKAERVVHQNSNRDFQSFGQSETLN